MPEDKLEASQRISSLLAQGMNSQARAEIENLLRDWPGDAEVMMLAGDVYSWTGAPSTAYRHYNSAADTYNRMGAPDKMLSVHHKILELDATLLDANTQLRVRLLGLLVAAEDALILGRYEQAVANYQEAIRQFPNHTVTYQRLATLFVRMNRPADAVQQFLTVARAFHQHGVIAKAAPYFERVLEIEPAHGEALNAIIPYLNSEGRQAETERPLKAAVQDFLCRGDNESAAAWFLKLPEAVQQDVTPLRAALLLQGGDLQQAEDAAKMLDTGRVEIAEWFKHMGRAALNRGDSVTADIYFRWGSPQASPAPLLQPLAPAAPEPIAAAPAPVAPPPALAPLPAPAFAAPAAPEPALAMAPPALAPPPAPVPAPHIAPSPQVMQAASPLDAASVDLKADDDRVVLQTMGEMCLAEDMFEEARQVFERLLRAEPGRKAYLELLNKSRAGLGLGPVTGPPPPPGSIPPPPPPGIAPAAPATASALGAAGFRAPAPVVLAPPPPPPAPAPVVLAPPPLPTPPAPAVASQRPQLEPVAIHKSAEIPADGPQMKLPTLDWAPAVPSAIPAAMPPQVMTDAMREASEAPAPERRIPALSGAGLTSPGGAKIVRTAHSLQLGELPPAVSSSVDFDDDIIE